MANLLGLFSIVLMFSHLYLAKMAESAITRHSSPIDFIRASCKATRYPTLCYQCLSGYGSAIRQSEHQLALTSLSVSLGRARSAVAFVGKLTKVKGIKRREYMAVKDCIEYMSDSVDRLSQSVRELGHVGATVGEDFMWHMSNVQTWVSAALTDETTCLDGFGGRRMDGNVKAAIRRRVTNVSQVTSNALALINRFAARHRATDEKH
ncbi:pectinesterase inhibitor 9-like [Pistacia vera]|uniref:pectinesterase inhibitor 9-like n=1 Tax=Pistacia vera TaxID=55513 RepID=UPI00126311E2|nr:pectinesterase inhibitor 9-like [Pistacia vera]